ncbi:hypothetical protein [Amycolatopsis taiwanensis]|uniref:hypothetical protein n=1 Tax=Amycolatopsis taiwanensis TaxID=342230 RepID=UPI00255401A9|nr:hypothetical protein [Amycolatopsis taiwanensis]
MSTLVHAGEKIIGFVNGNGSVYIFDPRGGPNYPGLTPTWYDLGPLPNFQGATEIALEIGDPTGNTFDVTVADANNDIFQDECQIDPAPIHACTGWVLHPRITPGVPPPP